MSAGSGEDAGQLVAKRIFWIPVGATRSRAISHLRKCAHWLWNQGISFLTPRCSNAQTFDMHRLDGAGLDTPNEPNSQCVGVDALSITLGNIAIAKQLKQLQILRGSVRNFW